MSTMDYMNKEEYPANHETGGEAGRRNWRYLAGILLLVRNVSSHDIISG